MKSRLSKGGMTRIVVSAVCGVLLVSMVLSVTGCTAMSPYAVRIEAIRATKELSDPVSISLWLYTDAAEKELTHSFISGRMTGTGWHEFSDAKHVRLPAAAVSPDEVIHIRGALNPNRFAMPEDAIFEADVSMPFILTDIGAEPGVIVLRALSGRPFELKLRFSSVK